ncbi:MAG: class I SAM-dependent methyltransferase, partial [Alphaproteobacteria bacterium]
MGSVIPSSPILGKLIAKHIEKGSEAAVLELGAGTGAVTHSLIRSGIAPRRIVLVEIVPEMAEHLELTFPETKVLQADAFNLPADKLSHIAPNIGTVICGIPLVLLPEKK